MASLTVIPSYPTHLPLPRSHCREPRLKFTEILLNAGVMSNFPWLFLLGDGFNSPWVPVHTAAASQFLSQTFLHTAATTSLGGLWEVFAKLLERESIDGWLKACSGSTLQTWTKTTAMKPITGLRHPHLLTPGSAGGYSKVIISQKFRVNCSSE